MSEIQYTFKRYEKKYLLTVEQYQSFVPLLEKWMEEDGYGVHTVCNIYYDTDDYGLVRTSIEKPPYKEKFRLRSYGIPDNSSAVYAEIKKKFDGIVYKRRVAAAYSDIQGLLKGCQVSHEDAQIQREIHWFIHRYRLVPKVFIGYERIAYIGRDDSRLRITFDWNIRWRQNHLDLRAGTDGTLVLAEDRIVMEIKFPQTSPLWLAALLSEFQIFSTGFSKYGTCYQRHLAADLFAERKGIVC